MYSCVSAPPAFPYIQAYCIHTEIKGGLPLSDQGVHLLGSGGMHWLTMFKWVTYTGYTLGYPLGTLVPGPWGNPAGKTPRKAPRPPVPLAQGAAREPGTC